MAASDQETSAEKKKLSPRLVLRKKIVWTCAIHMMAIALFLCTFYSPDLHAWIKKMQFRSMGASTPIGALLIVLPALSITLLWGGGDLHNKKLRDKVMLSCWLIFNVVLTLAYLFLIYSLLG